MPTPFCGSVLQNFYEALLFSFCSALGNTDIQQICTVPWCQMSCQGILHCISKLITVNDKVGCFLRQCSSTKLVLDCVDAVDL